MVAWLSKNGGFVQDVFSVSAQLAWNINPSDIKIPGTTHNFCPWITIQERFQESRVAPSLAKLYQAVEGRQ